MSTLKTVGIFAIIVGCFAILYPRFIHPIALRVLGMHKAKDNGNEMPFNPPHKIHEAKPSKPDMRQHMRHGPPPGLRAAAEMERERAQQGSGRGMIGVVLPMYAVGIVLYLIYTLVKVFNRRSGEEKQPDILSEYMNTDPNSMFDGSTTVDGKTTMEEFLRRQKNNELEKLLLKADDKNISCDEMRALQKRLEETESQMSSILKAMQAVSSKVDDVAAGNPDLQDAMAASAQAAPSTSDTRSESTTGKSSSDVDNQEGKKLAQSTDSSPDLDSFEIVGPKKGSSDTSNNTDDDLSRSVSSEIENIGGGYLPESEPKMSESESTESCAGDKDNNMVAPESEQGEADATEEVLPDNDSDEETTVRQRKVDSSNDS